MGGGRHHAALSKSTGLSLRRYSSALSLEVGGEGGGGGELFGSDAEIFCKARDREALWSIYRSREKQKCTHIGLSHALSSSKVSKK